MEKAGPNALAADAAADAKKENQKPEPPISFKSGNALPTIADGPKTSNAYDFPSLGPGLGNGASASNNK